MKTPGPWYWDTEENWLCADDPEFEDGGFIVLELPGGYEMEPEDARLIAAAPALYEALKRQRRGLFNLIDMSIVPTSYNDAVHEEIARIDAALALVEGES